NHEGDVRRLAQILDVDAIVVGTVTEYSPYYPAPRLTLTVAWYSANPSFHPIPAGYGLPWGTGAEKDIPGPVAFQAEFALAKEQLKTQTPQYQKMQQSAPADPSGNPPPQPMPSGGQPGAPLASTSAGSEKTRPAKAGTPTVRRASHEEQSAQAANP